MDEYSHNALIALIVMGMFTLMFLINSCNNASVHTRLCEIIEKQQVYINNIKEGVKE